MPLERRRRFANSPPFADTFSSVSDIVSVITGFASLPFLLWLISILFTPFLLRRHFIDRPLLRWPPHAFSAFFASSTLLADISFH
jgi:hypothetical protein